MQRREALSIIEADEIIKWTKVFRNVLEFLIVIYRIEIAGHVSNMIQSLME